VLAPSGLKTTQRAILAQIQQFLVSGDFVSAFEKPSPKVLMNHTATPAQGRLNRPHIDFEQDLVQFIKTPDKPSTF
jgi:hypothetical protein